MDLIGWKTEMAIWLPTIFIRDTHKDITADSSRNNFGCLKVIMDESESNITQLGRTGTTRLL